MDTEHIKGSYRVSEEQFRNRCRREEQILVILSVIRLLSFIGGLILIWFGFNRSLIAGSILLILVAVLFFYLLQSYSIHNDRKKLFENLAEINSNEIAALSGDISAFEPGSSFMDPEHDFSNDVDLFGKSSVFQYLNRTVTGYGRDILAGWLSDPYVLSTKLSERQKIIRELAAKTGWRQNFMAEGMKKSLEKKEIAGLLDWLGDDIQQNSSVRKKILIYLLPVAASLSFILLVSGIIHYSVFTFTVLINLFFITTGLKSTNRIHNILSKKYNFLNSLNVLLKLFENEPFATPGLNNIKLHIAGKNLSASVSVKKLGRLIQAFDTRMNMLMGVVLNGMFLWDFHCILRLDKWKNEYRRLLPLWLEMLGEVDAYISLGNYAYNNPAFVYPSLSDSGEIFSGRNLGHQLIDKGIRVCNDFSIERTGVVCIISGANMAGKSTFLRTVAVNYILAMTGAPVCADEMRFKPMRLFTSMRTTDSLSNNESYFYAELKRLRILKSGIEKGLPLFFILDEILKGTNSADKSLGSKLFLRRLVELGGTGLIATHDTSLGEMESEHSGAIINKCFEVEIEGEKIHFDYRLLDGITHKMNAAFLMKQMGILD